MALMPQILFAEAFRVESLEGTETPTVGFVLPPSTSHLKHDKTKQVANRDCILPQSRSKIKGKHMVNLFNYARMRTRCPN